MHARATAEARPECARGHAQQYPGARRIHIPLTGRAVKPGPFGAGIHSNSGSSSNNLFRGVRACCQNCKGIFLAEFSMGGSRYCSVDCRTMDKMSSGRFVSDKDTTRAKPTTGASSPARHESDAEQDNSDADPCPPSPSRKVKRQTSGLGLALVADAASSSSSAASP